MVGMPEQYWDSTEMSQPQSSRRQTQSAQSSVAPIWTVVSTLSQVGECWYPTCSITSLRHSTQASCIPVTASISTQAGLSRATVHQTACI